MFNTTRLAVVLFATSLTACATYPTGPSTMALPGNGASFDQFRYDDGECRGYAQQMVGGKTAQQSATDNGINSAAVGTVLGAAAGALLGAASGHAGAGAAIGAGGGLILGGAAGSNSSAVSGERAQSRYDDAYVQCMYAKGHQVPVPGGMTANQSYAPVPASPYGAPASPAPQLPGSYPPPGTPPPQL